MERVLWSCRSIQICVPTWIFFPTLRSWIVDSFFIGNDDTCKMIWMGKIRLQLYNGAVRVSDVRCVSI